MIAKRMPLLTLIVLGTLMVTACGPAATFPPQHSDELTDPRPVHSDPYTSLAAEQPPPLNILPTPTAGLTSTPAHDAVPVAALLEAYLRQTFGKPDSKAAWYDDVQRVTVQFNTAIVRTSLTNAPPDQEKAESICQAVAHFPNSPQGEQRRAISVQVLGQDSRLLASTRDTVAQHQPNDGFSVGAYNP